MSVLSVIIFTRFIQRQTLGWFVLKMSAPFAVLKDSLTHKHFIAQTGQI